MAELFHNNDQISGLGAIPSSIDIRDYRLKSNITDIPTSYTLPKFWEIKNQGMVGSCVGHAISYITEFHNHLQNGITAPFSPGFIYGYRNDIDWKGPGMPIRGALNTALKVGIVYQQEFEFNKEVPTIIDLVNDKVETLKSEAYPNRISGYYKVVSDDEIKQAILKDGPVIISVKWYKEAYVVNNVLCKKGETDSHHAMVIYGWNETGFQTLNSWGKRWGNAGSVVIPYDYGIDEAWGVTDDIEGSNYKKPIRNKPIDILYSLLNYLINAVRKSLIS